MAYWFATGCAFMDKAFIALLLSIEVGDGLQDEKTTVYNAIYQTLLAIDIS